jgi:hypothetical protein
MAVRCDTVLPGLTEGALLTGSTTPQGIAEFYLERGVQQVAVKNGGLGAELFTASGERFRIDSHCQSACTMFLSIRNVCVSPGATLLFHAGGSKLRGISPVRTQQMLSTYNAALQQYVTAHHFMDTFDFHPISGSEIIKRFGYPACR